MNPKFEAVKETSGRGGWAVKTQVRKNGTWFTAADTFAIHGVMDAQEMAIFIAKKLNKRVAKQVARVKRDRQTEGWVDVIRKQK